MAHYKFHLKKSKNRILGIRLTKDEHSQLFLLANAREVSVSDLVRSLIYKEIRKAGTPTSSGIKEVH